MAGAVLWHPISTRRKCTQAQNLPLRGLSGIVKDTGAVACCPDASVAITKTV